eukprot:9186696-Karenia_brevis.AAC.1
MCIRDRVSLAENDGGSTTVTYQAGLGILDRHPADFVFMENLETCNDEADMSKDCWWCCQ